MTEIETVTGTVTMTATVAMMPETVVPTSQGITRVTSLQVANRTIVPRGETSTGDQVEKVDRQEVNREK